MVGVGVAARGFESRWVEDTKKERRLFIENCILGFLQQLVMI